MLKVTVIVLLLCPKILQKEFTLHCQIVKKNIQYLETSPQIHVVCSFAKRTLTSTNILNMVILVTDS